MATIFLLTVNIVVYLLMLFHGVSWIEPTPETLVAWGGVYQPAIVENHEFFRLFKAIFIHVGAIHLFLNMYLLLSLGIIAEYMIGSLFFTVVYLGSGIIGNIASLNFSGINIVSCGASGALLGIIAVTFIASINKDNRTATEIMKLSLFFLAYNIFNGFTQPSIDNAAHIGGALTGVCLGLLSRFYNFVINFNKPNYLKEAYKDYHQGHFENAITKYNKAIKQNSFNAESYYYRGLAKVLKGYLEEGIYDLEKASNLYELQSKTEQVQKVQEKLNQFR